ncbi:hypothetical protein D3C77_473360 [compost metagenome]
MEGQLASVEQRRQGCAVTSGNALNVSIQIVVVTADPHRGSGIAIALNAHGQVMLDCLFQAPVAKAYDIAVVGISEQPGHTLRAAQVKLGVGQRSCAASQGCQAKDPSNCLVHA